MKGKEIIIVGAGFGGLSAAALLAKDGHKVTVIDKNSMPGGRAQVWKKDGFVYDMGPSWYLMPDVFEDFFALFGKKPTDYFDLKRLDPHYKVFYSDDTDVTLKADLEENKALFDTLEKDGGKKLLEYLGNSQYQYRVAMDQFLYRDYKHLTDFFNWKLVMEGTKFHVFDNLDKYVARFFDSEKIKKILEYNIVFLGGAPKNSPALYSLMSHVDFNLGVWYPMGGMGELPKAMQKLAEEQGAKFIYDQEVQRIKVDGKLTTGVVTDKDEYDADLVIVNADYVHGEMDLLDRKHRSYNEKYWDERAIAPSALLMFLGFNKKLKNLEHHNLYLQMEWDPHFETLFDKPDWPDDPCIYVCAPSVTDPSVAPEGKENIFVLVPVAPGLDDTEVIRDKYYKWVMKLLSNITGEELTDDDLLVKRLFAHRDFKSNYNAYKGTALGLAHTLFQTAIFRPQHESKKVKNLYYTGHYAHPGIGVPMVMISSQILADLIRKK